MSISIPQLNTPWPLLKKVFFRFFCIYFILYNAPWDWLADIPGMSYGLGLYHNFMEWSVIAANRQFFQVFHVKEVQQVYNGSGDTSFDWASNYLLLCVGVTGALIWSVIDRKRGGYRQLNYLLCLLLRYTLAITAFAYGIQKVFALQMPFPMLSQLATPLGDLLPMRFSWLFIGYSTPYEIFSGVMEVFAALLLLYRRTATMGTLVATAVFINVMMLNLCYDIPVKLYSINLVLMCLYLMVNESERILCFFVLNRPAGICAVYHYPLTKKWMRITRMVLKLGIFIMMGQSFYGAFQYSREVATATEDKNFKSGVYDVVNYVVNNDTIPALLTDTLRWQDLIIETNGMGSIKTKDSSFRRRYGRGYFSFAVDTLQPIVNFKKNMQDSVNLFSFYYLQPDSNTIQLRGLKNNDSLFIELRRSNRHFQLAEKQFHWLSEANR